MARLEVREVYFGYSDGVDVLRGVTLSADGGRVIAVLGPNGSGKTTLIKVVLGLLKPRRGGVYVEGRDVHRMSVEERGRVIAWVPQTPLIPFPYRVDEYVALGRSPYIPPFSSPGRRDWGVVERVLRYLGISHLRSRVVTQLSGGERQLAVIARALAQEPLLLLLDEPTAHLDLRNRVVVLSVISRLARERGVTVLMATHDPNEALLVADRVGLMRGGRLVGFGDPGDVLTKEVLEEVYGVRLAVLRDGGVTTIVPLLGDEGW